jgi:hypothetical protein
MTLRCSHFVFLALLATACRELTSAAIPDVVQTGQLNNPSGALVQRAGAIGDFAETFSKQVQYSGLISDELSDRAGGSFSADERRLVTYSTPNYPYDLLSQARVQSLRGVAALQQFAPTPSWRIGELFAYEGFVETMLAENMCSGTPIARLENGTPTVGPTLATNQLYARAIADFDSAQKYASGTDSIAGMATVGIARALLDTGNFAGAAAVAAQVPVGYQFFAQYAATQTQLNQLYLYMFANLAMSMSDNEGINGLDFVSANDPRLPTVVAGVSPFVNLTITAPASQNAPTSPILLASGIETQLIEAEAELPLNGGQGSAWLNTLNALRVSVPGLAPLTDPGSDTARVSLLFRERAFWLYLTGHRQGDLRRLIRQYHRPTESVFPTGPYYAGGVYGTAVAFDPFSEANNPNFKGCLSEGA